MRFGLYASKGAARPIKILNRLMLLANRPGTGPAAQATLEDIGFVLIDHLENQALRELCGNLGIRLIELDLSALEKSSRRQTFSEELLRAMQDQRCEYALIFGNMILTGKLLEACAGRLINFHPSLLPSFPGLNAIDQALKAGSFLLGNTAHFIDELVDHGPVIMQSVLHRSSYTNYESVLDLQVKMAIQIMSWAKQGRIRISGELVSIEESDYRAGPFIPALEEQ